jgi:hypothetical protein
VVPLRAVVGRDGGKVELARAARTLDGSVVDLGQGQGAVERSRGSVETLVLVLGSLDRLEHALGLHDAHHLIGSGGEQLRLGHRERGALFAIPDQHPAQGRARGNRAAGRPQK